MISKADQELFISENNSSIKAGHTKKVINQINKLEKKYGIDFADMNIEQTNELFTDTKSNSVRYLYETNVICERFIDTLKEKGNISKDVKNIYAGKDILYFSRFLKTTELYTEADVISFVNRLDNPIDKFIVSAVFFGIRTGEIEGITRNDIHKAGNYISIITGDDKRDVFVPRYTINAALDSIDTYIYVDSAGCKNNLIGDGIIKYRYIKKGNANSSYDYMHNKATRIFKPMFGKNFNYAFLRSSGIVSTTLSLYYKSDCKKISQLWNDREFRTKVLTQYGISDFSSFKKQYYYSYLKCKEK